MINTVHVDPAALSDLGRLDPDLARMIGDTAVRELLTHGELELSSVESMHELIRLARRGMPGLGWQQWQELIISLRRHNRVTFGASMERPLVNLTLRLSDVSPDADPHTETDPMVESATVRGYPRSRLMKARTRFAGEGHLPQGYRRQDFWSDVLSPLAVRSDRVTMVDRYMFTKLSEQPTPKQHGLLWLLEKLARSPGPELSLVLINSPVDRGPRSADESAASIAHWRGEGRIGRLEIVTAPRDEVAHDRHISFGCGAAIILPAGIDRFSTPDIKPVEGVNWIYRDLLHLSSVREAESVAIASDRATRARFI